MYDQKLNFLIIDDDPGDVELLRRNIDNIPEVNAEISSLSASIEAQAVLSCKNVDLVFIDYQLGGCTGLDIYRMLREANCTQPMIMLTGMGNEHVAVEAMKAGFADYIVKDSVAPSSLLRAITNALAKAAMMRQILEQQKELERLAQIDELTGLYNRRYFFERLITEISRSVRHKHQFSLLMLDLDHFKKVNDTYGHPFGDEVLSKTGKVLTTHIRSTDIAGRFGGEEFIVGLSNTSQNGAVEFAERIRKAIAEEEFIAPQMATMSITCSLGISWIDTATQDAKSLIDLADKALYRAKKLGRNRVCTYQSIKSF